MRNRGLMVVLVVSGAALALGMVALVWAVGPDSLQAQEGAMHNCPQPGRWAITVWGGPDDTETGQALATCEAVAVAAAYSIDPDTQGWSRWFAGRPEISTLSTLDNMQGVLALGAITPVPTPTPTGEGPELGTYSGTTSQGRPFGFDVVLVDGSRVVTAFQMDIEGTVPGGRCEVQGGMSVSPPPLIVNNTFSLSTTEFDVSGTFDSPTTASGDLHYHSSGAPFDAAPCDSGPLTWTASKQ